jgi:hypothetical protein
MGGGDRSGGEPGRAAPAGEDLAMTGDDRLPERPALGERRPGPGGAVGAAHTAPRDCTAKVCRFDDLVDRVLSGAPRLGPVRAVAVDGPAAAGKTVFAGRLSRALRARRVAVAEVHTDDLLDGWNDMVTFWPRLEEWVLRPLARGEPGRYRRYDWLAGRFGDDWMPVPVPDVLVLEGVTSARREISDRLSLSVLVAAPRALRLTRGLARDGAHLRPQWLRWMADEDAHLAADGTARRVDLVVDGAPTPPHQPDTEFVALDAPPARGDDPEDAHGGGRSATGGERR